ncbi:MAG: hypothetical protein EBT86_07220 [Actinobacteria bacterium]|nr:hypothetical protein [Actinomycetota bacterium]
MSTQTDGDPRKKPPVPRQNQPKKSEQSENIVEYLEESQPAPIKSARMPQPPELIAPPLFPPPTSDISESGNVVLNIQDDKSNEDSIIHTDIIPTQKFRHYHFKEIENELDRTFDLDHTNDSTILDIIVVYVKGQKILYTEAKTLCEQRLNALMIPAIFNTAICTILSLVLKDISFGATIVSILNGINALFLSLITYLKLDARAEAHRTSAYKFDKLQSFLEFNSGKVLFTLPNPENKAEYDIYQIMKIAEKEIREIKETNQFILPERVRFKFPTLYSTNVFSVVKEYMNDDMVLVNKLKDKLNYRQDCKKKLADIGGSNKDLELELASVDYECKEMLNTIIEKKKDYLKIDGSYQAEVENYIKGMRTGLCDWLKS